MDSGHRFDRAAALGQLGREQFDVLVIGGGVTGAGVALDAASRGLRTALVERCDFASGTSSKSSKMIHGGLRYLQQREFRLVYENLAERQHLLENAPHLVSKLPFLIPLFGRDGAVARAVTRSYSSALWLYDITGGLRIGSRHHKVTPNEALGHLPQIKTDRLVAGFVYFDARADDARLTLTLLRTAVLDHGAVAANYVAAESLLTDEAGRVMGARVRSDLRAEVVAPAGADTTGAGPTGAERATAEPTGVDEPVAVASTAPLEVRARVVINATGVWADELRIPGGGDDRPSLRPAKGVHLTVPASRLPCDIAAVIPVVGDRRSIFVVPWPEGDRTYIGTTDTSYSGPLAEPRCTPDDVTYLLDAVNATTTAALTPGDVTAVWAGLRPLLAPDSSRRVSERTSDLSRRHTVTTSGTGVVTVTGGKLTTYRKMAQDTVDAALRQLGDGAGRRCVTKHMPLRGAGGPSPAPTGTAAAGAGDPLAAHLRARYGDEWTAVLAVTDGRPELLDPIVRGLPYVGAEVVFAVRSEMACTVADVLSRRTRALLLDGRQSAASAMVVARLMGQELGWDADRVEGEAARFSQRALAELETAGLAGTATSAPQA